MKRASRFLTALILMVCVVSLNVSAAGTPLDPSLPDNVDDNGVGNGNEGAPTSPLDGMTMADDDNGSTGALNGTDGMSSTGVSETPSIGSALDTSDITGSSGTSAEDSGTLLNLALASNGASYRTVRLSEDKKTEEDVTEFFGGTNDSDSKRLNDGEFGETETASKSVAVGGTGRTFRFRFDLGASKTGITRIVLKNIQDSYSADPLNNRSFDENKFDVKIGNKGSDVRSAQFRLTKKQLGDNSFSYDVTLDLDAEAAGRYVFIEAGPVDNAFVLSLDEIQIYGRADAEASESENETAGTDDIKVPKTGDGNHGIYAVISFAAIMAAAAVILYSKKKTA